MSLQEQIEWVLLGMEEGREGVVPEGKERRERVVLLEMEAGRGAVLPRMEERMEGVMLLEMEARRGVVLPGMEAWREGVVLSDLGKQVVLSKLDEAADCTGDGLALPGAKLVSASFFPGRGDTG
ncbi:hypothetical protein NDU88_008791 [Pleurodeles waltl]|uniref:Uncharacterized protein n=1 Tax=Pleurodeles waltl TaxID=8319 RepID=A0AAV7QSS7_PLEWA|nr:hypothetical protein NDU88_008791 [Pleurodeles waltl]